MYSATESFLLWHMPDFLPDVLKEKSGETKLSRKTEYWKVKIYYWL